MRTLFVRASPSSDASVRRAHCTAARRDALRPARTGTTRVVSAPAGVAQAHRDLGFGGGQHAGDDEPAGRRALRLDDEIARAERARRRRPSAAAPEQRVGRALARRGREVDAAAAARVGERLQRRRIAARGAADREHRHREGEPPRRAVVREAVAEPERFVRRRRRGAPRRGCWRRRRRSSRARAAGRPSRRREPRSGSARRRRRRRERGDLRVAHGGEVGVEQRELAVDAGGVRPSPTRPRRSGRAAAAAAARCAAATGSSSVK